MHVFQSDMDETQLVLIGYQHGRIDTEIAVLDFGRMQQFCHKHQQESYHVWSGYRKLKVLPYRPRNYASITRDIPFSRCVSNWSKFTESRICSISFNWPVSPLSFLLVFIFTLVYRILFSLVSRFIFPTK
jgi:hypothetical protein